MGEREALVGHVGARPGSRWRRRRRRRPGRGSRRPGTWRRRRRPRTHRRRSGPRSRTSWRDTSDFRPPPFSLERTKELARTRKKPMTVRRVALLTAGGLAPCLSSAVGALIERYTELEPEIEIIAYLNGYAGLLGGEYVTVTPEVRERAHLLHGFGGSPIGNSRVKLTNVKDCVKRGLVAEGQDPLHVAAEQLTQDGVDVLHTIGGDDTNTTAADLAAYLARERLRADRRRPAEDDRQRRRADPAVAGCVDGRRAGRALRPQHHRRALLQPADAHRPRGDGPQLRVADGRDRGEVPRVARDPGVRRLRRQHPAVAGTSTASTCPSSTSTSRPRPSGSRRSWTRPAASTCSSPRAPASRRSWRR